MFFVGHPPRTTPHPPEKSHQYSAHLTSTHNLCCKNIPLHLPSPTHTTAISRMHLRKPIFILLSFSPGQATRPPPDGRWQKMKTKNLCRKPKVYMVKNPKTRTHSHTHPHTINSTPLEQPAAGSSTCPSAPLVYLPNLPRWWRGHALWRGGRRHVVLVILRRRGRRRRPWWEGWISRWQRRHAPHNPRPAGTNRGYGGLGYRRPRGGELFLQGRLARRIGCGYVSVPHHSGHLFLPLFASL